MSAPRELLNEGLNMMAGLRTMTTRGLFPVLRALALVGADMGDATAVLGRRQAVTMAKD